MLWSLNAEGDGRLTYGVARTPVLQQSPLNRIQPNGGFPLLSPWLTESVNERPTDRLALFDWRRSIEALYANVRALLGVAPSEAHRVWRDTRDDLFEDHSQSALSDAGRDAFTGLGYFDYDPSLAFVAPVERVAVERIQLGTSAGESMTFERFGRVTMPVGTLDVYWLDDYGGGVFVPFRDRTAGHETYGAGRYLLDTAKGADLGSTSGGELVLDFNFAYNPSCSYNDVWSCPLARPGSRLDVRIEAGERRYTGPR